MAPSLTTGLSPETRKPAPAPLPAAPPPVRSSNQPLNGDHDNIPVKIQTNDTQPIELLARKVARIMFGDEKLTEISCRLTRIALEHYRVSEIINRVPDQGVQPDGTQNDALCRITREVARIMFGDEGITEIHLRLTGIAFERYNVAEIIAHSPQARPRYGSPTGNGHGVVANY